ncbi:hypothetical protein EV359DRAFT_87301 [Lentinula novae-zelandiae]|nr:hypothetical protein EV359DRAFT_87301 [Lentinula novae-zelandiae]
MDQQWWNPQLGEMLNGHGETTSLFLPSNLIVTAVNNITINPISNPQGTTPHHLPTSHETNVRPQEEGTHNHAHNRATLDACRRPRGANNGAGTHIVNRPIEQGTTPAYQVDLNNHGQVANPPIPPNMSDNSPQHPTTHGRSKCKLNTKAAIKLAGLNIKGHGNTNVSNNSNKWSDINNLVITEKISILVAGEAHMDAEQKEDIE